MARKCSIYKGNKIDQPLTEIYQYIDTTPANQRNVAGLTKQLFETGVAVEHLDSIYIIKNEYQADNVSRIKDINKQYGDLVKVTSRRLKEGVLYQLEINEENLTSAPISPHFLDEVYGTVLSESQLPASEEEGATIAGEIISEIKETPEAVTGEVKAPAMETSLINAFSKAGIGSTIVRDENLVDAQGNPQRGRIESIGPKSVKVSINPERISDAEGLYHEFGHLYVDMLGEDNSIVRAGMKQAMQDSTLVKQVKAAYPEKTGDSLAKEVFMHKIGKEGSKIIKDNPSKFQILLNKFFRAVGKILGITPNAAAVLAEDMFASKLRQTADITLGNYLEESRETKQIEELAEAALTVLADTTRNLKARTKATGMTANILKQAEELEGTLKGITRVQDFVNYTTKSIQVLNEVTRHMELLKDKWDSNWGVDAQFDIAHIASRAINLMGMFKDPFSGRDIISSIAAAADIAPESDKDSDGMKKLLEDLNKIILQRASLDLKIRNIAIPILAATLLSEKNPELLKGVQNEIETIKKNFEATGKLKFTSLDKNSQEYLDTLSYIEKKKIKLDSPEASQLFLELKVSSLLSSASADYNTTVEELRKDYVDKSFMSLMYTSSITDSDVNFQRFQLIYARSQSNKQQRTRDLASRLDPAIRELKGRTSSLLGSLELSTADLYEKFTEEIDMRIDGKTEKVSHIIAPLDKQKYNSDIINKKRELKKKYKIETNAKYDVAPKKVLKSYYSALEGYINSISEPMPDAKRKLKEIQDSFAQSKAKLTQLQTAGTKEQEKLDAGVGNPAILDQIEYDIIAQEGVIAETQRKLSSLVTFKGVFKGELLQPKKSLYTNPKYEAIKNDPFYQFYIEETKKLQKLLPDDSLVKELYEDMSYMVPSARITLMNKIQTTNALSIGGVKESIMDNFGNTGAQEMDYGGHYLRESGMKVVPIYFNNAVPSKLVSKDLGDILMLYGDMAHNFEEKNKILGFVELYSFLYESSETGVGPKAINRNGIIRQASEKIGFAKLVRGFKNSLGVKTPSNKQQMIESYINANFYGQKYNSGNVTTNKIINKLMRFTAYDLLGFNMLQTGNQFVLDNLAEAGETYANQFYNRADKLRGMAKMSKLMLNSNFIGDFQALSPKNELSQLLRYFDVRFEAFEIGSGYSTGNRIGKIANPSLLLAPQGLVNLQIKMTRLSGLLASYKGKLKDRNGNLILNEDSKPADIFDVFQDRGDGIFEMSKEVDPNIVDQQRITNIFRGISRRNNQIEAGVDKPAITRTLFRPTFLFRGFMPGGIQSRWGYSGKPLRALKDTLLGKTNQHLSEELGRVEVPRYAATVKYFYKLIENFKDAGAWRDFAKVLNPLAETQGDSMYSDAEAVAIRRQIQSLISLTTTIVAPPLFARDDDDDEPANHFALYQLRRLRSELMFYVNPLEFYTIAVRSPTATARPFENSLKAIWLIFLEAQYQSGLHISEKENLEKKLFYQRKSGDFEAGDRKIRKIGAQLTPGLNGLLKDAEQASKWFDRSGL